MKKYLILFQGITEMEIEADNQEEFNEIMDVVFAADMNGFSIV